MDPAFVQGLHALLLQSTANDTVQLKAATAQLNRDFYKKPECIPALASIIANTPEEPVRQLAAVELRKRVLDNSGDFWLQLPQVQREDIKANLPQLVIQETSKLVRHATARVIAAIASIEIPLGNWQQLLPFLMQTVQSPQVAHREVGSFILFTVLENIVEGFQEHLGNFFQLFRQLLADPESIDVRITTVRSLGTIAQYLDGDDKEEIRSFQALLPAMITVVGQCVEAGNEEGGRQLFDVFETLLILETPLLGRHVPEFVQFLLACGANKNYEEELRILAMNALNWTVQYKKSKVQSLNLGASILEGLMPVATEEQPEDVDDDAPARSALRIIDNLATLLPPTQILPPLRTLVQQYFASADPSHRRAALLALGVSVEGVSEHMAPQMAQVWPMVMQGLNDADPSVRKAACVTVSCLCEWLEETCAEKHAELVPVLMNLVNDPASQKNACVALDALLEILGDNIDQYLQLIMERLAGLLDSAPLVVKSSVTGAIGSAAHASKAKFLPYFAPTMERLQHFLVLTGEGEEASLRGIAMDCVGTFAEAVGADAFRPYFPELMKQAYGGMHMGNARLRECSFLFFGVMAKVFSDEFAPYVGEVVKQLIASCKQDESAPEAPGVGLSEAAAAFATGSSRSSAIVVGATDESLEVDIEDLDADKMLDINSAVAVEKEIAADTMGTLFAATRNHFLPYVEECVLTLVDLLGHYYEGIRKSATDSLLEFVRTFYELSNPTEWIAGRVVAVPLDSHVKDLIGHVLTPLLDMNETEDEKSVVSSLCVGLAETINKVGPGFLDGNLEQISLVAKQVLEQKAICQNDPDQDDDEEAPEDQAEYDSVLISSAGDLVSSLANALGADFAPAFATFMPLIAKYYGKNRSLSDRTSAIGCLAEIIAGMKNAVTPWTEPLMETFYRALSDSEAEVQSNAAFAAGMLIEHSESDLSPQYQSLLGALHPLFLAPPDAPGSRLNAKDNAVGAVGRMIVRNTGAVPLERVLPLFVDALPLQQDYLENKPVFRAIFHLYSTDAPAIAPYTEKLLPVFAVVLDPENDEQLTDDTRVPLLDLVRALNAQAPAQIQAAGLSAYV